MLPNLDTFYERLQYAKEQNVPGTRWNVIANRVGIDKANFSRYKNGKYFPSAVTLLKIARVLQVDARWLAGKDIVFPEDGLELFTIMFEALDDDGKEEVLSVFELYFGSGYTVEGN